MYEQTKEDIIYIKERAQQTNILQSSAVLV